ncbi:MAG: IS630 family transposase [Tepidisphaeraceae bacterium]
MQRILGATADPTSSGDGIASAPAAQAAGQPQTRPGRSGTPAAAHRGQAGPDAGRTGRGVGEQGERADGLAGDDGAGSAAKKKTRYASEQDRPDVKEARANWFARFAHVRVDQLVFLDEFGATTTMARLYARGPRGRRVVCKTPHGHWKILSTIAALTVEGMLGFDTFDGATDTQTFLTFLSDGLVPHLQPGHVVVLDNLPAHKSPKVDALIESAGARVLRLPPYSPDFNPTEMAISKIKSILRKLARRSLDALFEAVDQAMDQITAEDALGFIHHCGYAATSG